MNTISENQALTPSVDSPSDCHTVRTDASVPRITADGRVEQVKVEVCQHTGTTVFEADK